MVGRLSLKKPCFFSHCDRAKPREQKAEQQTKGNRLAFQGDRHFSYDQRGNLIKEARGKDGKLVTSFTYNAQNQLVEVNNNGIKTQYQYDALGRRTKKLNQHTQTEFLWNGDVLLAETQNNNQAKIYVFEPYSFKPLAQIQNNEIYHYHLDHLGTPQELTKNSGEIVWSARYKTYGNLALKDVDDVENNLRFQGQYFDQETGLHYNRHRYYNPNTGQFTQQDPIGLLGGLNNYQYAPNPVGWIDPFGLSCKEDASGRPLSSPHYSVAFRAKLEEGVHYPGVNDYRHFQESNKQLHSAFLENPEYAAKMEELYPGINSFVAPGARGKHSGKSPAKLGLTWHHNAYEPGVLELIPIDQHRAPGVVQQTLHPNQKGGMEIWGGGER